MRLDAEQVSRGVIGRLARLAGQPTHSDIAEAIASVLPGSNVEEDDAGDARVTFASTFAAELGRCLAARMATDGPVQTLDHYLTDVGLEGSSEPEPDLVEAREALDRVSLAIAADAARRVVSDEARREAIDACERAIGFAVEAAARAERRRARLGADFLDGGVTVEGAHEARARITAEADEAQALIRPALEQLVESVRS